MMSVSPTSASSSELPDVDERLVAPETGYEIEDGRVVHVPPAHEPHGVYHSCVDGLLRFHRAAGYEVAVDMLTRTSRVDDIAPDLSVYPGERDPRTGGRRLEELAFEVVSTASLAHAGRKAAKLVSRGVRRVFAIDVENRRALEWSKELGEWSILDGRGALEDPALAIPVRVETLVDTALVDDAIARALRLRRHPEFLAERAEGRAEGRAAGRAEALLVVLASRGLEPSEAERRRILEECELARLDRWLAAASSCVDVAGMLAVP